MIYFLHCPHCGAPSGIDPLNIKTDDPILPYCTHCQEALFIIGQNEVASVKSSPNHGLSDFPTSDLEPKMYHP